ncbi:MAG: hypothetical protein CSA53_04455 [Gammaproteobacteria bacterium]|nr:MAG: hypothetical protein CSA53_04455 [Gammaproteobacteria bacterium]
MLATGDVTVLPEIISEDCVFLSPVIHTPQEGRDIAVMYLSAAAHVLRDGFHYVKEVVSDNHAVLEFICTIDDITVNGVDIMTFNEDGLISEFKVMVRPKKAMDKLHEKMKAMLEALAAG